MQKMTPAILTGTVFGLLQSFGLGQETHPIRVNARYEMNWANIFFKKFRKPSCLQTDGRTDRHRGESSIPPFHLRWIGGIITLKWAQRPVPITLYALLSNLLYQTYHIQNLNVSRSCLCPIHWSQVLSREWLCSWISADRRCSNSVWVINNFIAY